MLDTTADTWHTWLGLVAASLAVAGVAAGLPAAPPPDPGPVAATVDGVAASPHEEVERVAVVAEALRLGERRIALRSDGGTAHETFRHSVVPVRDGRLGAVLAGRPPESVFRSPAAFERALRAAADRSPRWRPPPDRLTVRRVSWEGVDATLVG